MLFLGWSTSSTPPGTNLDGHILKIGTHDTWTVTNAFEGTQIFGATGSGKTSGSGQHIAVSLLKAGFGGLVLTVKTDECALWQGYARLAGREEPIVFGPLPSAERPYCFNFLEYERRANEAAAGGNSLTDNLVSIFSAVIEVSSRSSGGGGKEDAYWQQSVKQLLRNAIDLMIYAKQSLTFRTLYDIIISAPSNPLIHGTEAYNTWLRNTPCGQAIDVLERVDETDPLFSDSELTHKYWTSEYPNLSSNTRSIILSFFTSMADPFLRGNLRSLFSSPFDDSPQLCPELTHSGKVIILDIPIKMFNEMGQFAQTLYKFIWQRATERRDPRAPGQRPVFLWIDESQFFVNSNDMLFMTTARSKQVAAVYLTQNISNYYAIMPGEKGRAETDALMGNFNTKIFHAQGDSVTNLWAAELIGKALIERKSRSASVSSNSAVQAGGNSQFSSSQREELSHQVLPVRFTTLKKGGKENNLTVSGVIFQTGRVWSNGKNFLEVHFDQVRLPPPPPPPP